MAEERELLKINKKLQSVYGEKLEAKLMPNTGKKGFESIEITGELDSWDDIVSACMMVAKPYSKRHIVNHIKLKGVEMPKMRLPKTRDNTLQGMRPDVLVIGGGVSGAAVLRELSKWDLNLLLVEKESDLAMQASGRNDGEVHPGVDQGKHNLKHKYVLLGNKMYDKLCADLDVPFKRVGQYVAIPGKILKPILGVFAIQRRSIGVKDTKVISKEKLYKAQPKLNEGYDFGLSNDSTGIVCPYGLTIALAENAVSNGARVSLNTAVLNMEVDGKEILSVETNRGTIYPKLVINCAGTFSDVIAKMAGDEFFSIHPRRGTNSILDRKAKDLTESVVSFRKLFGLTGTAKHTKGGGIMRTVDDNILVGPDAVETYERENFATHKESIKNVFDKQRIAIGELNERDIITYFTGVRAASFEEDFIIEMGRNTNNLIHMAAIQSPGITAAPAIALDVEKMAIDFLKKKMEVKRNESFNPKRKGIPVLREMEPEERNKLIKQNPDYGVIVCRCEEISKGEIIDALKRPIVVPTIDGVKKRVRPGMGRCQGGFCQPVVTKIISDYLGMDIESVRKNSERSDISFGKIK